MSTCVLCDDPITPENDSKEHIIPNAIGGRKKVTGFICKGCNNTTGDQWEAELAKQLNPLSLLLSIKRERKNPHSQVFSTTGDEQYKLNHDGSMELPRPLYQTTAIEKGVNVKIQARTIKEAKQLLNKVKKDYPQINLEQFTDQLETQSTYCSDMLEINGSIEGHDVGRSIVKSVLSLVVDSRVQHDVCEHANTYLRGENKACWGYYYCENDLVINRPEGVPLHCVYVSAQPETKQILGYVELFGIYRMVICLSSSYEGREFKNTYAINPISGKQLNLNFKDLKLSVDEIDLSFNYKTYDQEVLKGAINSIMMTVQKNSFENEKEKVIRKAVKYALENCGAKEGETLTEEHTKILSGLFWEKFEPFILHHLTTTKK